MRSAIRTHLQIEQRVRDLALFSLAIDSKLRDCDVVAIGVDDIAPSGHTIVQTNTDCSTTNLATCSAPEYCQAGSNICLAPQISFNSSGHMNRKRPFDIVVVATLMIAFGVAEIATGFTHNFLRLISTTSGAIATTGAAAVGVLYAIAGALLIRMKKRGAAFALASLALVVIGRVLLVARGCVTSE